jgi:hypothetical protein
VIGPALPKLENMKSFYRRGEDPISKFDIYTWNENLGKGFDGAEPSIASADEDQQQFTGLGYEPSSIISRSSLGNCSSATILWLFFGGDDVESVQKNRLQAIASILCVCVSLPKLISLQ